MEEYAVVFERGAEGEENRGAHVPDLPGCISTGETLEEARQNIREAIELHLEGLRAEGFAIPEPTTLVERVPVAA